MSKSDKPMKWTVRALLAAISPQPEAGATKNARALAIQRAAEPLLAVMRAATFERGPNYLHECLICRGAGKTILHKADCPVPAALEAMEAHG